MTSDATRRLRDAMSATARSRVKCESCPSIANVLDALEGLEERVDRLEDGCEKQAGRMSLIEAAVAEQRGIVSVVRESLGESRESMERLIDSRFDALLRTLATRDTLRTSHLRDDNKTPTSRPLKIGPVETKLPVWAIMTLVLFGISFLGIVAGVAYVARERVSEHSGQTVSGK